MSIKPLYKKVLVAQNYDEVKSESGLILDGVDYHRDTSTATVLAIGPDVTDVVPGNVVLIEWAKAVIVNVDGEERAMIDQDNIMMILE